MEVLREENALEPTVKRMLLQAASTSVQTYLDMLQTVPGAKSASAALNEEEVARRLLADESIIDQAGVVLKFSSATLPTKQSDQPFFSLQSLCVGPTTASTKVFANLTSRDTDIRNLILR